MCGRFTLLTLSESVPDDFGLDDLPEVEARYNIAPTQDVLAVRRGETGANELAALRWGLVPSWSDGAGVTPLINARAETVHQKPSFQESFERRRCLIPADGYYEWKSAGRVKQPFHIRQRDRQVFAMAGLWDLWRDGKGGVVESCAIVTTGANDLTRGIHSRMPVILGADDRLSWLDPSRDPVEMKDLLRPFPSRLMETEAVSTLVNSVANDHPDCLKPAEVNLELGL